MSEKNKGLTFNHDRLLSLFKDKCGLISEFQDFRIMYSSTYLCAFGKEQLLPMMNQMC